MNEWLDSNSFVCMVSGDILENLLGGQWCAVLIVSDKPNTRRLIIFVVCYQDIVGTDLKKVAFRWFSMTGKSLQALVCE